MEVLRTAVLRLLGRNTRESSSVPIESLIFSLPLEIREMIIELVIISPQPRSSKTVPVICNPDAFSTATIDRLHKVHYATWVQIQAQENARKFKASSSYSSHKKLPRVFLHRPDQPNATPLLLTNRQLHSETHLVLGRKKQNLCFALDMFHDHCNRVYVTWICVPYKPEAEISLLSATIRCCPCKQFDQRCQVASDVEVESYQVQTHFTHSCPTRLFQFDVDLQVKLQQAHVHLHRLEVRLPRHWTTMSSMAIIQKVLNQLFTTIAEKHRGSYGMDNWNWLLPDMLVAFSFHTLTRTFPCLPCSLPTDLDSDTNTNTDSGSDADADG